MLCGSNAGEIPHVCMCKGAAPHREIVNQRGPNCDLHTLNRIHDGQPKLAVKSITLPDGVEMSVWDECVIRLFERMPIRTQPVVPNRFQTTQEKSAVGHNHPTLLQKFRLIFVRQWRLGEFQVAKAKKDPPRLCVSIADRGRAGVLLNRICICRRVVKP